MSGASCPAAKTAPQTLRLVRGGTAAQAFQSAGPAARPRCPCPASRARRRRPWFRAAARAARLHPRPVRGRIQRAPPAHVKLAADLFEFILEGCTPGGEVIVTITYPQSLPAAATQYWKHGPRSGQATGWYAYPRASISGSTVVLTLTDGALGDDDLDATNGRIVDMGGPAVLAAGGHPHAVAVGSAAAGRAAIHAGDAAGKRA